MKDETAGVAVEEFSGLNTKMHSYLVNIFVFSKHKKEKDANKNAVATKSHNEYIDVLLNKKCLRHSMITVQRKDRRTE